MLAARHLRGITLIPPGREADRLGGLPVHVLPAELELIETLEQGGAFARWLSWPRCRNWASLRFGDAGERLLRFNWRKRGGLCE